MPSKLSVSLFLFVLLSAALRERKIWFSLVWL
jgi:hypothetical protein